MHRLPLALTLLGCAALSGCAGLDTVTPTPGVAAAPASPGSPDAQSPRGTLGPGGSLESNDALDTPPPPKHVERYEFDAETGRVSALRSLEFAPDGVSTLPAGTPRIVYVHGTPGDATSWNRYLEDPVSGAASVAMDRPGFGFSEPQGPVVSLVEQAAALEPLLVDRPVLVGHSLGGPIIAMAAALWPDRVGGLVIISGSMDPELEELRWYNHLGTALSDALSRELLNSNEEILALEPELRDLALRLDRVRCPVTLIHGTDDDLVPYANVDYMRAVFSAAQGLDVITLEGADHFILWRPRYIPVVRKAIARLVDARDV